MYLSNVILSMQLPIKLSRVHIQGILLNRKEITYRHFSILDAILDLELTRMLNDTLTGFSGFLDPQNLGIDTTNATIR